MSIERGLYRHYKGKLYMVYGVGKHTETLEDLVMYCAMYNDPEFGQYALWTRPVKMFFEEVEVDGQKVPRFSRVRAEEAVQALNTELAKLGEDNV